jgi:hypothetical protein
VIGDPVPTSFRNPYGVLIFVVVPFVSWTLTALIATLAATGRPRVFVAVLCGIFGLGIVFALLKGMVPQAAFDLLSKGWLVLSGGLYLGGTAWAFFAAVRRRLISTGVALPAVSAWVVATIVTAALWPEPLASTGIWFWHGIGFLALGILPFAAMPLAVQWNRHR